MFANQIANAARRFTTTAIKRGEHGGIPGENLPFKLGGPVKTTCMFLAFFAIPFGAPFLIVRYQMLKS